MRKNNTIITIDGPAGSGKTTAAKEVARRLGFLYLDTGAMYRAMTLKALNKKFTEKEKKEVASILKETKLSVMKPSQDDSAGGDEQKGMRIWLDGEEITDKIRTEEVTNNVWWVCNIKEVREEMKKLQQGIGANGEIVVEGRDIGTVVFPDAAYKFYLDASIDERAKRRWLEQTSKGIDSDIEKIKQDIEIRDRRDMERELAPLKKAEDAVVIDTTGMTIEEVIEKIIDKVNKG
ncbi:MAG: (d)CMP kinase [Candidatus Ratteibacteria bacterium]|nr:(d)CMP kinase [Candidatus Ratteibacteria bacterium]